MSRQPKTFSETDWLAELARLGERKTAREGFLTCREIMAETGRCKRIVLLDLQKAKDAGRLETRIVYVESVDGKPRPVTAYRVRKGAK
jgi:hypothetical protein